MSKITSAFGALAITLISGLGLYTGYQDSSTPTTMTATSSGGQTQTASAQGGYGCREAGVKAAWNSGATHRAKVSCTGGTVTAKYVCTAQSAKNGTCFTAN